MTLKTWLGAVSFGILSLLAASQKINLQLTAEEQLFAWVRSFGGKIDGITLMNPGDGPRGLFTTKEFVNESIIMVIPPEVMIHKGFVLSPEINPAFSTFYQGLTASTPFPGDDCTLVALYLMFENFYNRHQTPISPYLVNLPSWTKNSEYFSFIPRFWNNGLRALFQTMQSGKNAWDERMTNHANAETFVRTILYPYMSDKYIIPSADYLHEQFVWAGTIVHTRAWGDLSDHVPGSTRPYKGPEGTCTVVPLADMLNHRSDAAALTGIVDFDPNFNESVGVGHGLQALQHLKAGDQIYDNYSPAGMTTLCNINLMLTFGFIDPDPEYDCFTFHIELQLENEKFAKEQKELLRLFEIIPSKTGKYDFTFRGSTTESSTKYYPDKFMVLQRVLALRSLEEYNEAKRAIAQGLPNRNRIAWSIQNEYLASRRMKQTLLDLGLQYETNIEEDVSLEAELQAALGLTDAELQATGYARETLRRQKVIVEARRREHMTLVAAETVLRERWGSLMN